MVERVIGTEAALQRVAELRAEHGPIFFHQSGGCCDGSTPTCFKDGELTMGADDVRIGQLGGVPYYVARSTWDFSRNLQLIVDVQPGDGATFSLENGLGWCFMSRSRLFTDAEVAQLAVLEDRQISAASSGA